MNNIYFPYIDRSQLRLCDCPIFSTHNTAIDRDTVQFEHFIKLIEYTTLFPVCIELDIQWSKKKNQCEIGHRGFMGKGKAIPRRTSKNITKRSYDSNIDIYQRINDLETLDEDLKN